MLFNGSNCFLRVRIRFLPVILFFSGCLVTQTGCGGQATPGSKKPDKVSAGANAGSAWFKKSPATILGFDGCRERLFKRKGRPLTWDAWPIKAVELGRVDPIQIEITGYKPPEIKFGAHADGEVSMPDEAIAATQMVQDRDVKGNTEINGPDRYGIGYALRGNMNVAGFLAKVYRPKILNVGYAIVKLPGDPAIMGEPLSKIGHGIKKILRQAAVRIDFIDFGTVIVDYDTDGDGVLDATGPNALVEWRKILTALQARPSFNSAERIICYVNGFDDPYADGGLQNPVLLPHMCFVKLSGVTSVFNESCTERDAAHELCHTLGLNEYNPSTEAQSESAEENAEDIENLMWSPLPKPTDYALLLTGHLRPWQWDIINGHVTE